MKKLFSFSVILTLLFNSANTFAYSDIRPGSELEDHLEYLSDKGIIDGYPDGSFKPEQSINRAEALKIIFAALDSKPNEVQDNPPFSDVPLNKWFTPYIQSAKDGGIISGYPDGSYKPSQFVNRAEFIKITMSALPFFRNIPQKRGRVIGQFKDVHDPLWYTPYVSAALELNFIPKTNYLRPTDPMQRQEAIEMITLIDRYLGENVSKDSSRPHIPESAFLVIEPTISDPYNPQKFGPDKLTTKKKADSTEVSNHYAGYHFTVNEGVEVTALEMSDWQLTLDYQDRNCMVDIYTDLREKKSAEQYHEDKYKNLEMMIPTSISLETFTNPKGIPYGISKATWKGQDNTHDYFLLSKSHVYHFSAFGYGGVENTSCAPLVPEIVDNFELL